MVGILHSRIDSYRNSGAVLTKDNKIILPHAEDADYNTDNSYREYLADYLALNGISDLAKEMHKTPDSLIHDLIGHVDKDFAKKCVTDHLIKERL